MNKYTFVRIYSRAGQVARIAAIVAMEIAMLALVAIC
jgi:hypothetical protein